MGDAVTNVERRLAAVLAGDVVGFSRLVDKDEDGTLARVQRLFDLIVAIVPQHGGRIVKTMGDGFIAEFASVVAAFEAARSILSEIDDGESTPLAMRMGLHVGDVVIRPDGDILGNGVNIASRLEAMAQPGRIAISGRAAEELRRKRLALIYLGSHKLKNIAEPVSVYEFGGNGKSPRWRGFTRGRTLGLAALTLVVALGGYAYWRWSRPAFMPESALAEIPCSWLRANGHSAVNGRDVWSVSGFSMQTPDAIRQMMLKHAVDVDRDDVEVVVDDLIPIERGQCRWIEKVREFRYLGVPRISVQKQELHNKTYTGYPVGTPMASYKLKLNLILLRRKFYIYGIEPDGTVSYIGDRKIIQESVSDDNKVNKIGDELEITINQNHGGASGLIVLEADHEPPRGIIENQMASTNDIRRFEEIGHRDRWSISFVQYIANLSPARSR